MVDINAEVEKSLSGLDCRVEYYYPESFVELPVVSYYQLTERPDFGCDNVESIQTGTVVIDIWSEKPSECGAISLNVNKIMTSDGWGREFSRDLPKTDGIYHKTMRFSKDFYIFEEE